MSYELTVENRGNYLLFEVTGANTGETVNRGLPLAFFSNIHDATIWIESRIAGSDEQYHFWDGGERDH